MAKKGNRIQVILECTEHKESGMPGTSRYITTKNRKNTPDRMEIKKYNPILKRYTIHKEIRNNFVQHTLYEVIRGNVEDDKVIMGSPAFDNKEYKKSYIGFRKLPDIMDRLKELEKSIKNQAKGE